MTSSKLTTAVFSPVSIFLAFFSPLLVGLAGLAWGLTKVLTEEGDGEVEETVWADLGIEGTRWMALGVETTWLVFLDLERDVRKLERPLGVEGT